MSMITKNYFLCIMLVGATHYSALEGTNWTAPVNMSISTKDAIAPQVAVGDNGNCTGVWSWFDGTQFVVQSSQSKVGKNWTTPTTLSAPDGHAFFAKIALDSDDNPIAVWSKTTGNSTVIQSSQVTQRGWSTPTTLSTLGGLGHNATKPQIATSESGYEVVIWQANDGINNIVQAVTRKNNNTWSSPENITNSSTESIGDTDPQVAIDSKGNLIAVWLHTPTQSIQASTKQQKGHWSHPVNISSSATSTTPPQIAMDDLGNAVVVWTCSDGINRIVQSTSTTSNGGWSTPVNLSYSGQDAYNPQLVVDSGGNATAVWERFDGANTIVQASTRINTKKNQVWSAPVDLSVEGEDASAPQIYTNAQRMVAVVWKRSDGSNFIIQASAKGSGASWSSPVSISAAGQDATSPQIAIDKQGNIIALWQRSDGQNLVVQSAFRLNKKQ